MGRGRPQLVYIPGATIGVLIISWCWQACCHGQRHEQGGRPGNRVVSDDVKGDYSVSKVSLELVLRNWCFGWGVSRYPGLIRRQQLPSYNLQKRFFVCLFVCFVCLLLWGWNISNPRLARAVFLYVRLEKGLLGEWVPSKGFIEVVLLSFKTCHVGEADFFPVAIFW